MWGCDASHLVTALAPQLRCLKWYWSGASFSPASEGGAVSGNSNSGSSGPNQAPATFPAAVATCTSLRAVCVSQLDTAGLDALLSLPHLCDVSVTRGLTLSGSRSGAVPASAAGLVEAHGGFGAGVQAGGCGTTAGATAARAWRRLYVGGDVDLHTLALLPLTHVEELCLQVCVCVRACVCVCVWGVSLSWMYLFIQYPDT